MKKLLFLIPLMVLMACSTIQKSTRVSTTLHAQEYNTFASQYMEKPTSVALETFGDGQVVLMVEMKTYGIPNAYSGLNTRNYSRESLEMLKRSHVRFVKDQVSGYVGAIDKFLEWAALANARNDAFSKEISSVPGKGSATLNFKFHSGNDQQHYLVIVVSALGISLDDEAQYYDTAGAKELKRLLLAFASGSIQQTDIGDIYK